jgi:hypothetical protein
MTATTFLVFYRFKALSKEEKQKAESEWSQLRNSLPSGIELVGEYIHAWGTKYNGFLLFEAETSDSFLIGGQTLRIVSDGTWKRQTR